MENFLDKEDVTITILITHRTLRVYLQNENDQLNGLNIRETHGVMRSVEG
jgi:hypothetical protein